MRDPKPHDILYEQISSRLWLLATTHLKNATQENKFPALKPQKDNCECTSSKNSLSAFTEHSFATMKVFQTQTWINLAWTLWKICWPAIVFQKPLLLYVCAARTHERAGGRAQIWNWNLSFATVAKKWGRYDKPVAMLAWNWRRARWRVWRVAQLD